MRRFGSARQTVLTDAMKIAKAKERLERAMTELACTIETLEEILRGSGETPDCAGDGDDGDDGGQERTSDR